MRTSKTLTERQKQLVIDNHGLIYKFLNYYKLGDDYYDIAALALCKAACGYDAREACFVTFAYCCMKNEVLFQMSKDNKQSYLYYDDCDSFGNPFIESLPSKTNVFNSVVVREFCGHLCDVEKMILFYLINNLNERDLSEMLSCTQQYISKIRKGIQSKWAEYKSL